MSSRTRSLLVGGLLLFAASPAAAQDDFVKKEAEQRFHEGTALMDQAKYEQARAKFLQAYTTGRVPNVTFNLARVEFLTGRHLEATRHFREYLRTADPRKVTPQDREKIDAWLKETATYIARLDISAPSGATVTVDGESVGSAPLRDAYDVGKGKHVVVAQLDTKKLTAEVDAPAGTTTRVVLQDEGAAMVPPAKNGSDVPKEVVPPREPDPSYSSPQHEPSNATRNITTGVIAGLAVVSAGIGLVFTLRSNSQVDDATSYKRSTTGGACAVSPSQTCTQYTSMLDDAKSSRTVATGAFVVSGVFALGSGATFLLWPANKSTRGSLRPTVVQGGLGVVGEF